MAVVWFSQVFSILLGHLSWFYRLSDAVPSIIFFFLLIPFHRSSSLLIFLLLLLPLFHLSLLFSQPAHLFRLVSLFTSLHCLLLLLLTLSVEPIVSVYCMYRMYTCGHLIPPLTMSHFSRHYVVYFLFSHSSYFTPSRHWFGCFEHVFMIFYVL